MRAEAAVDAQKFPVPGVPDLERIGMESDDAKKSGIENDLKTWLLISEQLVLWLIILEVTEFLSSADDALLHGLRSASRVRQREGGELISGRVEGLHAEKVSHIPDLYHA